MIASRPLILEAIRATRESRYPHTGNFREWLEERNYLLKKLEFLYQETYVRNLTLEAI